MASPQVPDHAEGLLDQIADTALDDDYYVVRPGPYRQAREVNTVLTGLVLAVFALMVCMAALQTRNDRPATERERKTLIGDVAARKESLADREVSAQKLREQVDELSTSVSRFNPAYEVLRVQAADSGATGPGVTVVVSPSTLGNEDGQITDNDLQLLVNGLWYAGAEAVSLNGHRIGTMSSIQSARGVILVNYKSIGPPYTVVALGDSDALADRFEDNPAGRYWAARHKDAAVSFNVTSSSDLSVPGNRLGVKHAAAIKEDK